MRVSLPEAESFVSEPESQYGKNPMKINFIELEQRNLEIGLKGESLIIDYEKWRLNELGKSHLADKVEWIAQYDDSAGFDILSKNDDETDRYIEVKTTKLAKETPIFFSRNEYEFSLKKKNDFHLYRVFDIKNKPRFFSASGTFDDFCRKEAMKYRGFFGQNVV